MSRSYKKHPIVKDKCKGMKRIANQIIRRQPLESIPNGMGYKKIFDSWSISDFFFRESWKEYLKCEIKHYNDRYDRNPTEEELKEIRNEWEKMYKRK